MTKKVVIEKPIEKVGNYIKRDAWLSVFESMALVIIGIAFVMRPELMKMATIYVIGAILCVKGAFEIVNYFIEKGQKDLFNNNLLNGVVLLLLGIVAFVAGREMVVVFQIIMGIFIVYEGLKHLDLSLKLHSAGIEIWKYVLILAIITLMLGVFVTFSDWADIIGWMLIISGVINMVGDFIFIRQTNNIVDKLTGKS